MKTKNCTLIAVLLFVLSQFTPAQDKQTYSGIVTSFKSIPLNKVMISGTKSGQIAYSDESGQFSIMLEQGEPVMCQAAGFKKKKVKTGADKMLRVDLAYIYKPISLQEATLNGHITMDVLQKALEAEELKKVKDFSKYSSIWELIDNEIYEVRVTGNAVYNNKIKSMDANPQVVYVVDEKIVNDISYINPMYVKSIEFVEDVGATLYGSRGANGALKITLK